MLYQDDPDSEYDARPVGSSYLVTLNNGPCAGAVVEALTGCQILCVPYGDSFEMYRQDMSGDWWHAGRSAA
jgi:hypothetical protein